MSTTSSTQTIYGTQVCPEHPILSRAVAWRARITYHDGRGERDAGRRGFLGHGRPTSRTRRPTPRPSRLPSSSLPSSLCSKAFSFLPLLFSYGHLLWAGGVGWFAPSHDEPLFPLPHPFFKIQIFGHDSCNVGKGVKLRLIRVVSLRSSLIFVLSCCCRTLIRGAESGRLVQSLH